MSEPLKSKIHKRTCRLRNHEIEIRKKMLMEEHGILILEGFTFA